MPLTPEIDFIVVGQGIAGSCLAYELLERGARTIVYDDGSMYRRGRRYKPDNGQEARKKLA